MLERVAAAGGRASTAVLRRQLEQEGIVVPRPQRQDRTWGADQEERGSPATRGSKKFEDIVARLGAMGLAFSQGSRSWQQYVELARPGQRLVVPEAVLQQLPKVTLPVEHVAAPPVAQPADPGTVLRDVYVFVSLAGRQPLPLTTRGQIMKRSLVALDAAFQVHEDAAEVRSEDELSRLPLLRALLEDLDLLATQAGGLAAGEAAEAFLQRPPGERLRALVEAYRGTARWCELFQIEGLAISGRGGSLGREAPPRVVAARQRVLAELSDLAEPDSGGSQDGQTGSDWISYRHLVERLQQRAYEFLFPRPAGDPYYSSVSGWGEIASSPYQGRNELEWIFEGIRDEAKGWDAVEGGFIRAIVEALHWLGVVDLGFAAPPGAPDAADDALPAPAAFRITAAGRHLLRGAAPPLPAPAPHVVVQPNFQVFAFPPTGEDVLFRLDRFAERVRAEQVVEYRLTHDSVYRAQRSGLETHEMLAFLEQISQAPLPQNVRRTLEEWGAQHERIVVRRGAPVLQAVDAATLDALYADPALQGLLGRRLAPGVALVPRSNLQTIYRHLLERGQLPALSDVPDDNARPLYTVEPGDTAAVATGTSRAGRRGRATKAGGAAEHPGSQAATARIVFRHPVPSAAVVRALRAFADDESSGEARPPAANAREAHRGGRHPAAALQALRLTPASLRRAARSGLDADLVIGLLGRWHAGPLPEEAVALVRRWTKDWGSGALATVTLLRVQTADVLADLLADPEVGPHLQPIPGAETLAIVPAPAAARVRAALEARGMAIADQLQA